MSDEENIRKAYLILGLEPGTEWPAILTRYKRCVMVWHPDRAPDDPKWKDEATEELKKFNWAKDILKPHFENGRHNRNGACACKPSTSSGSAGRAGHAPGPGPGRRSKTAEETQHEEAEAKRKSEERARKAAEEAAQKQQEQSKSAGAQSMQDAVAQDNALKEQRLRWQIAAGLGVAFIALCLFGWIGTGVKSWWHDVTWQWERDHAPKPDPKPIDPTPTPYVPPYEPTPGGDNSTWQQQQDQEQKRRDEEAKKQKDQDIYFAKLEIDKYEKMIEHCNSELTQLELKISDAMISDYEKNKLRDMRDFRQKNLAEGQAGLQAAQEKLRQLQGDTAPVTTTPFTMPFNSDRPGIPLVPIPDRKSFFTPIPTTNTSPFAPAQNPDTAPLLTPPTDSLMKKYGLDKLTVPDSTSGTSLYESFKKRQAKKSLQELLNGTGTNTGTSP